MSGQPNFPFDRERLIGTVVECSPTTLRVNLPLASKPEGVLLHGNHFGAGEVGEYVCIETDRFGILGRLNQVKLPERDRLAVEPRMGKQPVSHPIGTVQLLCSVSIETGDVTAGITIFPRIGAAVYSAHPDLLCRVAEFARAGHVDGLTLSIATLAEDPTTPVKLTPEKPSDGIWQSWVQLVVARVGLSPDCWSLYTEVNRKSYSWMRLGNTTPLV